VAIQILLQNICEIAHSYKQFSSEIKDRSTLNYTDFMTIKKFPWQRITNTEKERSLGCRMWANGEIARMKYQHLEVSFFSDSVIQNLSVMLPVLLEND